MKHRLVITAICALALPASVLAAPGPPPKLNKHQLERKTCGKGKLVVNAVQKVVNDVDSGTKGNFWAYDDYTRTIKVWRLGQTNYCSIVSYDGTFRTIAGPSPGGGGIVTAGMKGNFQGGYRMDFNGTLLAHPAIKSNGSIGTVNYRCDSAGNCPGSVYWVTQFFGNVTGDDFDWWGWLYKAGGNGTWLNSIDGAKGDIVALPDNSKKKQKKR
jgi:hypothetical protein